MKRSSHLDHLLGRLVLVRSENEDIRDAAGWLRQEGGEYRLFGHCLDGGYSRPREMSIYRTDIVYPVIGSDLVPKLGTGVPAEKENLQ